MTATPPTWEGAREYLGVDAPSDDKVRSSFASEAASQAHRCRVPVGDVPWPDDLVEALYRRVANSLAVRAVPLGLQVTMTEAAVSTVHVGGLDAMVRRLEAPYRKLVIG